MRLLADENFPKPVVAAFRTEGHDVLWARTDRSGATDVLLLDLAEAEARIVLTLDKDFWQIAVQRRSPLEQSGVVGRTYQHHHDRRNSNGRSPQNVNRLSSVYSPVSQTRDPGTPRGFARLCRAPHGWRD